MAAAALYVIVAVLYAVRIVGVKRRITGQGKTVPASSASYKGSLAASAVLMALPLLVPLAAWLVAVVCACGVLGEFIVLRDRLSSLSSSIE